MAKLSPEFDKKFQVYFKGAKAIADTNLFSYKIGRRYVKVISGHSVHSFVDMNNGDVLKPASYSAPAKHARGNINDDMNGLAGMTPYGPYYLK